MSLCVVHCFFRFLWRDVCDELVVVIYGMPIHKGFLDAYFRHLRMSPFMAYLKELYYGDCLMQCHELQLSSIPYKPLMILVWLCRRRGKSNDSNLEWPQEETVSTLQPGSKTSWFNKCVSYIGLIQF